MSQEKCLTEKSYYTNSIRAAVYSKLCKNYAGFKQNRSRGDQIATQSENSSHPHNVVFVDFEKAFYTLERETL